MEVVWRKSTHSGGGDGGGGGDCVEVAELGAFVGVRDSKAVERGHLSIDRASLLVLVQEIKVS
ncbi:DUF397 domain-containing protein [Actinomadura oligospora]|uniref:DUF397 domain-containing protein n=1 Tax=Actinomadura oligospora TaxID=111804 RepID=UPI000A05836A|nr:DUF397 domain-containing protein [Actinomadura oligospora]